MPLLRRRIGMKRTFQGRAVPSSSWSWASRAWIWIVHPNAPSAHAGCPATARTMK